MCRRPIYQGRQSKPFGTRVFARSSRSWLHARKINAEYTKEFLFFHVRAVKSSPEQRVREARRGTHMPGGGGMVDGSAGGHWHGVPSYRCILHAVCTVFPQDAVECGGDETCQEMSSKEEVGMKQWEVLSILAAVYPRKGSQLFYPIQYPEMDTITCALRPTDHTQGHLGSSFISVVTERRQIKRQSSGYSCGCLLQLLLRQILCSYVVVIRNGPEEQSGRNVQHCCLPSTLPVFRERTEGREFHSVCIPSLSKRKCYRCDAYVRLPLSAALPALGKRAAAVGEEVARGSLKQRVSRKH